MLNLQHKLNTFKVVAGSVVAENKFLKLTQIVDLVFLSTLVKFYVDLPYKFQAILDSLDYWL